MKYILLIFILLCNILIFAEQFPAKFSGDVEFNGKQILGAKVNVYYNNEVIFTTTVKDFGFIIKLEMNGEYILEVASSGYLSPKYSISTIAKNGAKPTSIPEFNIGTIQLIENIQAIDNSIFSKPIAKVLYNSEKNIFEFDVPYNQKVNAEIEKLKQSIVDFKSGKNIVQIPEKQNEQSIQNNPETKIDENSNNSKKDDDINANQKNNPDNALMPTSNNSLQEKLNALKEKEASNDKQGAADLYNEIGKQYYVNNDLDKAKENLDKAKTLNEELGNDNKVANVLKDISALNYDLEEFDKALDNLDKASEIKLKLGKNEDASGLYNEMGLIAADLYRFDKALENFNKALDLMTYVDNKPAMTNLLNNIGNIYFDKGDFDKALNYYKQTIDLDKVLGNEDNIAATFNNMGVIYENKKDFDNAVKSYEDAMDINEKLGKKKEVSISLNNLGNVNFDWNKYTQALDYYLKSLEIKEQVDYKKGIAFTFHNIGNVYNALKKFQEALEYYQKSAGIAKDLSMRELLQKNYSAISKTYMALNDCKNAFEYSNLLIQNGGISLSLNDTKQINEMIARTNKEIVSKSSMISELKDEIERQKMMMQFQNNSKQFQLALKNIEISESEEKAKSQRNVIYILVGGLFSILLLTLLLVRENKKKKKANILLESQNAEIQNQAILLQNYNKELEKLSLVASQTDNSVLIADSEGIIIWANEGFSRLFGYTLDEFKSLKGDSLLKSSSNEEFAKILNKSIETKQSITYTSKSLQKNGKEIWVQTNLSIALDENNNPKYFIAVDSDITKIKQAEQEISLQRDKIKEHQTEIIDSINYAKRIQNAILPTNELFALLYPENFVIFKPRDIVSGDFYWMSQIEGKNIIAVADCTGHGVPGAFMSMLGIAFLKEIVVKEYMTHTAIILNRLRKEIVKSLQQQGKENDTKDGMDIVVCNIDQKTNLLQFSGANNSIIINRKAVLHEFKGDKMPIGIYEKMDKFVAKEFQLEKDDVLFMQSDGFADQFGGPNGKKYKMKYFREKILEISDLPLSEQKILIEKDFNDWKGNNNQIDDVLVVAVKI